MLDRDGQLTRKMESIGIGLPSFSNEESVNIPTIHSEYNFGNSNKWIIIDWVKEIKTVSGLLFLMTFKTILLYLHYYTVSETKL